MRLSAALVAIFAATASCLYEDQAGKVDWFRKNIGGVTHAAFHASGAQRLALVATCATLGEALVAVEGVAPTMSGVLLCGLAFGAFFTLVVPVVNDSEPLPPLSPATAVRMLNTPLDVAEP